MSRKSVWLLAVLIVLGMIASAVVWTWYRDRREDAAVDALVAELAEHGDQAERQAGSLPPIPERPTKDELDRYREFLRERMRQTSSRADDLRRRADAVIPTLSPPRQDQLQAALARYASRLEKAQEKFLRYSDELRSKTEALRAAGDSK